MKTIERQGGRMGRRIPLALLTVVMHFALDSFVNAALVLDFNAGTENDPVGTLGIATFTNTVYAEPGNPAVGFFRDVNPGPGDTIAQGTPTTFITEPLDVDQPNPQGITIDFSRPVRDISFDLLDLDWDPGNFDERYTITLTDTLNGQFVFTDLASVTFPTAPYGDASVLPLSFGRSDITRMNILMEVVSTGNRAGFGVDNLRFTAVPESPWLLHIASGLLFMALLIATRTGILRQEANMPDVTGSFALCDTWGRSSKPGSDSRQRSRPTNRRSF